MSRILQHIELPAKDHGVDRFGSLGLERRCWIRSQVIRATFEACGMFLNSFAKNIHTLWMLSLPVHGISMVFIEPRCCLGGKSIIECSTFRSYSRPASSEVHFFSSESPLLSFSFSHVKIRSKMHMEYRDHHSSSFRACLRVAVYLTNTHKHILLFLPFTRKERIYLHWCRPWLA